MIPIAPQAEPHLARERDVLVEQAVDALAEQPSRVRVRYELRYRGQSFELGVEEDLHGDGARLTATHLGEAFADAHESRYGYRQDGSEVELVNIRVSAWGRAPELAPAAGGGVGTPSGARAVVIAGRSHEASLYAGELAPGTTLAGPALCALPGSSILVPPGWSGEVDDHGSVLLQAARGAS
jgi:N-methylhydantoinase A